MVTEITDVPVALRRSTVTPATPVSPLSWMPLAFVSSHTKSPKAAGFATRPASIVLSVCPAVSVTGAEIPVSALAFESAVALVPWLASVKLSTAGATNCTS